MKTITEATGLGTTSRGIVVTANASANTKGSATQLIASTAYEGAGVWLSMQSNTSAAVIFLDLMIGAATESVLVPNIVMARTNQIHQSAVFIPVRIPKGSRISAKTQSSVGGALCYVLAQVVPTSPTFPSPYGRATAYGLTTASTTMVDVDAGASADTKGAFTEIVASTTNPIHSLIVGVCPGSDVTTAALCYFMLDIAVGAATETVVIPNISLFRETASDQPKPTHHGPYPVSIPAGSRISARAQCSVNTAGDRVVQVGIWGLD